MKKDKKKGQVTTFVIVGVVLAVLIILILFFNQDAIQKGKLYIMKSQEEARVKENFEQNIDLCIKQTIDSALVSNANNGGYFELPKYSAFDVGVNVPYYFYKGKDIVPSEEIIFDELGGYVDNNLYLCLSRIEEATLEGYNIKFEDYRTEVLFSKKGGTEARTKVQYILSSDYEESHSSDFVFQIDSNQYYEDILVAKKVAKSVQNGSICISCVVEPLENAGLFLTTSYIGNNTYLFDIKDRDYLINNEEFHLRFGVKYD